MAVRLDLAIEQGADFWYCLALVNKATGEQFDLTGYAARSQFRSAVDDETVLLELTTASGGLAIDASAGLIWYWIPNDVTAGLVWTEAVHDLEIYKGDQVVRVANGRASVSPEVTR